MAARSFLVVASLLVTSAMPLSSQPTARAAANELRRLHFVRDFAGGAEYGDALPNGVRADPEVRAWHAIDRARSYHDVEADALADSIRRDAPASPWGTFAKAFTLHSRQQSEAGIALARKLHAARPRDRDVLWLYAYLLDDTGKYNEAIAVVDSAARIAPLSAELHSVKATSLASLARRPGADSTWEKRARAEWAAARRVDPEHFNARFLPSQYFATPTGDTTVFADLQWAAARSPYAPAVHSEYWSAIRAREDLSTAVKDSLVSADVARMLADRPHSPAVLYAALEAMEQLKRPGARDSLRARLFREHPTSVQVQLAGLDSLQAINRNLARKLVTDTASANAAYRTLLRELVARPTHPSGMRYGDLLLSYYFAFVRNDSTMSADSLRRFADTLATYNRINPRYTHVDLPLAVAERKGDARWAERMVLAGDTLQRRQDEMTKEYYIKQYGLGKYAEIVDAQRSSTLDALGWIHFNAGRTADADREFAQAGKLVRVNNSLQYHLGRVAEARGDTAAAIAAYAKVAPAESRFTGFRNRDALKRVYVARGGSPDGFDAFLAKLKEEDRTKRRTKVLSARLDGHDTMPAFSLARYDGDGARVSSASLKGKIVVLNFWGVWCGPCVAEIDEIEKLHKAVERDTNVVFLTIDYNDDLETLRDFMAKRKLTFPVLRDADSWVTKVAKVSGYPTTLFFGPDGKLAFKHSGASDVVSEEFGWRIEALRGAVP